MGLWAIVPTVFQNSRIWDHHHRMCFVDFGDSLKDGMKHVGTPNQQQLRRRMTIWRRGELARKPAEVASQEPEGPLTTIDSDGQRLHHSKRMEVGSPKVISGKYMKIVCIHI